MLTGRVENRQDREFVVPEGAEYLEGEISCRAGWLIHLHNGVERSYFVQHSHYRYVEGGVVHVVRPNGMTGLFFEGSKISRAELDFCIHPPCLVGMGETLNATPYGVYGAFAPYLGHRVFELTIDPDVEI